MASRRFNFIFKDGCEYETTLYEGGICIKSDFGGKILELGHYQTLDVLAILETFKDDLKAIDGAYDNPIEKIEEDERMEGEELTLIMNYPCKFHSTYKGWELYRAWDIVNDHGRMLYFASGITPSGGLTILQAGNLDGIKKRVSEVARMQLEYNELKEIIKKNVREFINDKAFDTLSESEKCVLKRLMGEFTVRLALDITNTEMDKLDRMADEEVEE